MSRHHPRRSRRRRRRSASLRAASCAHQQMRGPLHGNDESHRRPGTSQPVDLDLSAERGSPRARCSISPGRIRYQGYRAPRRHRSPRASPVRRSRQRGDRSGGRRRAWQRSTRLLGRSGRRLAAPPPSRDDTAGSMSRSSSIPAPTIRSEARTDSSSCRGRSTMALGPRSNTYRRRSRIARSSPSTLDWRPARALASCAADSRPWSASPTPKRSWMTCS